MTNANQKLCLKVYPHTIYNDIVDLPDPMLLGLTIHYYNHSDTALYMKIFGSGPSPWSSNAVELGSLASGTNAYINLDNFLSRTKPTEALTEELTLTLKGYTDSGYSDLKYEFSRACTIVFIKSDDGTWTTDYNDNFDDGTVQGWNHISEVGPAGSTSLDVATDYVLSTPYSLKMTFSAFGLSLCNHGQARCRMEKSLVSPDKTKVFAIMNLRNSNATTSSGSTDRNPKYLDILDGTDILVHLGRVYDTVSSDYLSINKWMRIVIPLPLNTNVALKIRLSGHVHGTWTGIASVGTFYLWLDDFKIISK